MNIKKNRLLKTVLCPIFAALTAVFSQIIIPLPSGVPINLTLFAVYLSGAILGPLWGAASQIVFIGLALAGVPVLAGFGGGMALLLGKTGGYILGYVFASFITGLLCRRIQFTFWRLSLSMLLGCISCYLFGTVWFSVITGTKFLHSLILCVLPYLPGDIIKILAAAQISIIIKKRLSADFFDI